MPTAPENLLIGAHTSAAGGAYKALLEGVSIGATTIQLFTANQRRWASSPIPQKDLDLWHKTLSETGLKKIMSHSSFLINLGSPDLEALVKSRKTMREEVERCLALKLTYLNFHPGAALSEDPQGCLDRIAESLLELEPLLVGRDLRLLLETTAGQGSCQGYRFEQIAYIISKVEKKIPIGVCIDTCHIFVAGYDIRNANAYNATLNEFDKVIGLKHLYAFHVNDSLKGLGTRVDRHAPLGEGLIGMDAFRFMMTDPRTRDLPMYLETPGGTEQWKKEIPLLRSFASQNV
ncbi:MAG: deoxyribonuclease IV [Parachlamydiaceae bacterium]|nr:deoxyribonuclease IV [Parachlamydiaceae bacterium]